MTLRAKIEKQKEVVNQKLKFINEIKQRLIPISEIIIFCGRQGLALRGSQDTGRISEDDP